ncbi:F-box domain containing protein [Brugia malayi]|uniref:Bm8127 n=1 Tax=Brugia malayi TaxID=6279 RepID=A0A0K0JUV3_BRUMA|nr:F-box domain containing protein [Brugia malayi]CRZ22078.1 Bm8127 [Brugia malayi]VIO89668.1 F-box domain containing protein [Brugia malayi]
MEVIRIEVLRMLDILSDDVIWRLFRYLDVKSRTRFAAVNTTFYKLFNKWEDVLCCSIRIDGITLSGKGFILEVDQHSESIIVPLLKRCPLIRKLAIHDENALRNVNSNVLHNLLNVHEIYISSNFFTDSRYDSVIESLFSFSKLHLLHIQQRYNDDKCHRNIICERQVAKLTSTSLSDIKLQGVVVTGSVLKLFCFKYQKTLEKLCLLGALIPSEDAPICFQAINNLDHLTCLTLAPSLYSISTTNKAFFKNYPSLKNSKMLKLVAVYVSKPDISQLKLFLQQILPSNIEQLILYDESYRIAYQIEQELNEFKCKIHFCRADDIIIDSYWMNGKSELITHTVWKPPYKINTYLPAMLPEWYCVLSELMETARIDESSSRSSSSADTARNTSQYIDECTGTDDSASCSSGNETVRDLYSVQDKTLKHCKT